MRVIVQPSHIPKAPITPWEGQVHIGERFVSNVTSSLLVKITDLFQQLGWGGAIGMNELSIIARKINELSDKEEVDLIPKLTRSCIKFDTLSCFQ